MIEDNVGASDNTIASLETEKKEIASLMCPVCGSVSKEHHDRGSRICFNKECRHVFSGATHDEAAAIDELVKGPTMQFQCPVCGKASKQHHQIDERICSSKSCRHVFKA